MSGYIAVQRGFFDHHAFKKEPFTEREAWLWLISEASWKPETTRVGDTVFNLNRGELAHACRYMAKAWQWHHLRVWRFLKRLESDRMIETQTKRDATHITICNYDKYQSSRNADETQSETPVKQPRNKEEPLNHLTKEIDRSPGDAIEVHREFLKVARSDADDQKLWGSIHQIDGMLARGFTRQTILAGAAKAMQGKSQAPPWSYFAKCIESENEQRSAPAKTEIDRGKSENLAQTAKRLSAEIVGFGPRPSLTGGGTNSPDVRLLSEGGGERS
mgnify:FL=1